MMNLSLPLLAPRDTQSLWYTPSHTFGFTVPPRPPTSQFLSTAGLNSQSQNVPPHHHLRQQQQQQSARDAASRNILALYGPSALAQLAIDEEAVGNRKKQIARFGATWMKPPGCTKTLQGKLDEEAEREEQMNLEETMDEGIVGLGQNMGQDNGPGGEVTLEDGEEGSEGEQLGNEEGLEELEEEADLDADIPEAESDNWSGDEDEEEEVDLDADVPEAESEPWSGEEDEDEDENEDEEEEYEDVGYDENTPARGHSLSPRTDTAAEVSEMLEDSISGIEHTEDESGDFTTGDGSPLPITPVNAHIPQHSARSSRQLHQPQDMRRRLDFETPPNRSHLQRQVLLSPGRGHDSSSMFMSEDEMEVDD